MSLFPASPVLRIGLYMLLGALSAIGLLIAFAGAVAYLVIVIYPLLAIWLAFGLFVAVSAGTGRAARAYVYGNLDSLEVGGVQSRIQPDRGLTDAEGSGFDSCAALPGRYRPGKRSPRRA